MYVNAQLATWSTSVRISDGGWGHFCARSRVQLKSNQKKFPEKKVHVTLRDPYVVTFSGVYDTILD